MASTEWIPENLPVPPPAPGYVPFATRDLGGAGGKMWLTSDGTNLHYDGSRWTPFRLPGRIGSGYRIAVVAENNVWMVGNYGTVGRFDGSSWTAQKLDRIDYDLRYIAAQGDKAWIAGSRGTLHHFDGRAWSQISIPGLAEFHLSDLFVGSPSNIHVVACRKYDEVPTIAHFDGARWTMSQVGQPGCFDQLRGSAADDIWAVGFVKKRSGESGQAAHFDGTRWVETPLPTDVALLSVSAVNKGQAWAVGGRGTILRWDGHAWNKSESGVTWELTSVLARSDGSVVAAGARPQILRRK
jgi:photosystem II stability/assembly factor-like uncharacterized protein